MLQNNSGFLGSILFVTRNILIINAIVWFATFLLKGIVDINHYLGLYYFTSEYFYPHQIITSMFAHADFSHMFFNMFAVFMFGRTLEAVWGPKRFLTYYMLTGIGAALIQLLVAFIRIQNLEAALDPEILNQVITNGAQVIKDNMSFTNPDADTLNILRNIWCMVGASGAVFGVLVAFGMLFPNVELIMIPIPIPVKAKWFVMGYGALELYLGFANNPNDNVAHFAHLGGLLTGVLIILYWRSKARRNGNFF
mgnify:CR=1 FL=1